MGYESLFTPFKIGNMEVKNRIGLSPMGTNSAFTNGRKDAQEIDYFIERAKGGTGILYMGCQMLNEQIAQGSMEGYLDTYTVLPSLTSVCDGCHRYGAKIVCQISPGTGRNAFPDTFGNPPISASALPSVFNPDVICHALTKEEIAQMMEGFKFAAGVASDAGFDAIEIHAHAGYLIDQFMSPVWNKRTDEYGGSFENRYRFPVEIVKAVKKACGKEFPVSLRYSVVSKTKGFRQGALPGEGYTEVGRDMEESERAAKYLQDAGYDMLNCDNGTYDAWYWAHPPGYMPENCNLEDVEHIKKFVDIPVVCAGRMTPQEGASAVKENKIDAVGFARQFLTDPAWVTKLMEDREEDIKPCICCHNACFNMAHYEGVPNIQDMDDTSNMSRCALNPMTMQSKKYKIVPARVSKSVAVIGGGIGGMETALVAAARGHAVTLYEKTDRLGGIFIEAAAPSFKEKDRNLIEWYRRAINNSSVTVKLNSEIKRFSDISADEIIVATGSAANKPPIPGIEYAMDATTYLDGIDVGEDVAIIGGGLTGCEIAYDLILKGKKPTVIEMKNDLIAVKGVCLANSSFLREMLKYKKAPVYLNTKVKEILKDGVIVETSDGKTQKISADSVILSVGYHSMPLFPESKNVHLVGDADHVGNLRTVIWRAWDVAMKL